MDTIAREFHRQAGDRAKQIHGFTSAPNGSNYLLVTKNEIPIFGDPNVAASNLALVGIAHAGEYFPVIAERETGNSFYLSSPLSRAPSNAGKWCQVQTSTRQIGWIMVQPSEFGSKPFGQIIRQPVPVPVATTSGSPSGIGDMLGGVVILAVILLVIFGVFSNSTSTSASSSNFSGETSSYSYESSTNESSSDDDSSEVEDTSESRSEPNAWEKVQQDKEREQEREDHERGQRDGSQATIREMIWHDVNPFRGDSKAYDEGWKNGVDNQPKKK